MRTVALTDAHISDAAHLLAQLHGRPTGWGPVSVLADRQQAEQALGAAVGDGLGVVAVDGSSLVGYMVAPLPNVPGSPTSRLRPAHHAARPELSRAAYRHMYEALAGTLAQVGCTYHSVPIAASVPESVQAFFELEFGVDQVKGAQTVGPHGRSVAGGGVVRTAAALEIDALVGLAIELQKFHSRSPMLQAALLPVPAIRDGLLRAIADDAAVVLVADGDDGPVAMMQAEPDTGYVDTVVIGMNIVTEHARSSGVGTAVLRAMLNWAADRGYRYCTVGWTSSNLMSDSFYRSRGFAPIRYRLHRRIDARVAWANERLDYGAFRLH